MKLLSNFPQNTTKYSPTRNFLTFYIVKFNHPNNTNILFCFTPQHPKLRVHLHLLIDTKQSYTKMHFFFHLLSLKVPYGCVESVSHFRGCSPEPGHTRICVTLPMTANPRPAPSKKATCQVAWGISIFQDGICHQNPQLCIWGFLDGFSPTEGCTF